MRGELHSRLFNHGSCQRNESKRFHKRYVVNAQMLAGFHVVTGQAGQNPFSVLNAVSYPSKPFIELELFAFTRMYVQDFKVDVSPSDTLNSSSRKDTALE